MVFVVSSAHGGREVAPDSRRISQIDDVRRYLDQLDLTRIRESLCVEGLPNTRPISRAYASFCEFQYKRWLFLRRKFEGELMPPTKDIDIFWHAHILDTFRYHEDCDRVFGYYLHHNPYFGTNGQQDEENWRGAFRNLLARYVEVYGTPLTRFVTDISAE